MRQEVGAVAGAAAGSDGRRRALAQVGKPQVFDEGALGDLRMREDHHADGAGLAEPLLEALEAGQGLGQLRIEKTDLEELEDRRHRVGRIVRAAFHGAGPVGKSVDRPGHAHAH